MHTELSFFKSFRFFWDCFRLLLGPSVPSMLSGKARKQRFPASSGWLLLNYAFGASCLAGCAQAESFIEAFLACLVLVCTPFVDSMLFGNACKRTPQTRIICCWVPFFIMTLACWAQRALFLESFGLCWVFVCSCWLASHLGMLSTVPLKIMLLEH